MEIIQQENNWLVKEGNTIHYQAKSETEARSWLLWYQRPVDQSGNPDECINC